MSQSDTKLTRRQAEVWAWLADDGQWYTSSEIADRFGARSKASMTGLLRTLKRLGRVEAEPAGSGPYHEWRYRAVLR